MNVVALGLSHSAVPIQVQQRLAMSPEKIRAALRSLPPAIDQAVILSTYSRTEVYALTPDPAAAEAALKTFLADQHGVEPASFRSHCYFLIDAEAVRHLFRVVCGQDSAGPLDEQVEGSVRRALGRSQAAGTARRPFSTLFRRALEVGQRVGQEGHPKGPTSAQAIVEQEVERAVAWWRSQQTEAATASLRRRAEEVRRQELAEALGKLPSLTPQQRAAVEALSRTIVRKVLCGPAARLRDGGDAAAAVEELFGLKEEG